ncbi:MAG: LuxR C-terminal-related transcriptional regulator [Streptosporangiaceae bacterium]|jgi:DNA-binding CsgD family transcriptional regulator
MGLELWISVISAVFAFGSAAATALLGARANRQQIQLTAEIERQAETRRKQDQREDLMSRIRDPLLHASFDLQMRIFNIVSQDFLGIYLLHGSDDERVYAERSTLFVFAQYMGWVEIVRQSVQFLDLGDRSDNRKLVNFFSKAAGILSSDSFHTSSLNSLDDRMFRVFRAEQRAIGEIMIRSRLEGEMDCIGYADFCSRIENDQSFSRWLVQLSKSVEELSRSENRVHPRLVALQHNLVELINFLDPDNTRFQEAHRTKLEQSPLTRQEVEILGMLEASASSSEIAERLGMTPGAADYHVWNISQRLEAESEAEAVEIAKRNGWL